LRTTVVLPEPEPPATPITSGGREVMAFSLFDTLHSEWAN